LKVQTVRREGGRSGIATFASDDLGHPFWGLKALANGDHATHDVANHVVQKSIAFKLKAPVGALSVNVNAHHGFDGRQGLTTAGPEGGKIVFAQ
jgi:hypothetical protein